MGRGSQKSRRAVARTLLSLAVFGGMTDFAAAQEQVTWRGGSGNWNQRRFWMPAGIPNNSGSNQFSVYIDGGNDEDNSEVTLNINATISNLTIDLADKLGINSGRTLTIEDDGQVFNFGRIDFNGATSNRTLELGDGARLRGGGIVQLNGSGARLRGSGASDTFINENNFILGSGEVSGSGFINRGVWCSPTAPDCWR